MDLRVLLGSGIETVDVPTVINPPKVMKIPHHQRVEIFKYQSNTLERKPYPSIEAIQNVFALALKTSPEIMVRFPSP